MDSPPPAVEPHDAQATPAAEASGRVIIYPEVDPTDDRPYARFIRAASMFGQNPGPIDITFAKVGNRYGFIVTMTEPVDLEINVRSPILQGEAFARWKKDTDSVGYGVSGGDRLQTPPEIGASVDMLLDGAVVRK